MEDMQIDPMVGANAELQMSKEELVEFMKIPIEIDEVEKTDTFNSGQIKQTQELPKPTQHDECMPNMIYQERMEIEPYHRKSNGMIENCCFEYKEGNEVGCTHRLDLDSPLNYAVVPEHVANRVVAVQVPLLNIYSMELEVQAFPQVNHFE